KCLGYKTPIQALANQTGPNTKAGTHTPRPSERACGQTPFEQPAAVVMGPGFRRDDTAIVAAFSA
ncbi:hypothetical protein PMN64_41600, partial [Bradyrhizobium sp. UFLA01-814]|uniref:hypothetical protein n=1 Tax=Bradyrhizobium sp. UFLA01-814 TaxID=3023480 RepID=UPI00398B18A2